MDALDVALITDECSIAGPALKLYTFFMTSLFDSGIKLLYSVNTMILKTL